MSEIIIQTPVDTIGGVQFLLPVEVAAAPLVDDELKITTNVSLVSNAVSRREFIKLLGATGVLLFLPPLLQGCATAEPPSPYPYATPEPLDVGISLTAKDGKTVNFQEKALGIPREKIVRVRKNLEVVNLSQTAPILIQSTLEPISKPS